MSTHRIDMVFLSTPVREHTAACIGVPDWERALWQHDQYRATLEELGVRVVPVAHRAYLRPAVLVAGDVAILGSFDDTDPRQHAAQAARMQLATHKILYSTEAPARFSAADTLRIDDRIYIQIGKDTNHEGAAQAGFFLHQHGYDVQIVESENTTPLSKAAVYLGEGVVLIHESLAKNFAFLEYTCITVPHQERGATNAMMVNGQLVIPRGYSTTAEALRSKGIAFKEINISEFEKMDIGLQDLALPMTQPDENRITLPARISRSEAA